MVFDCRSAFKNGVLEEDILEVLSLHPSEVDRHRGRPSPNPGRITEKPGCSM